jgi:hypothetical protein
MGALTRINTALIAENAAITKKTLPLLAAPACCWTGRAGAAVRVAVWFNPGPL